MLASLRSSGVECASILGDEEEESGADEAGSNVISDLIAQGATLMAQTDRTGETALHLAARYARADAAKRLLDAGADPNAHDNMGRTPLHAAVAADAQGVFQVSGQRPALSSRFFRIQKLGVVGCSLQLQKQLLVLECD